MEQLTKYIREVKDNQSSTAFYKVVQLCEARVFTMCYRIIGNREEAEEAAQDTFMSSFKNIKALDDDGKFIQWLMRIAYHKSIDYVRKKKMKHTAMEVKKLQQHPSLVTQPQATDQGELGSYLTPCDEDEKAILTLYYQEEYSTKEIAKILGITVSNVKIKLHRARIKIREFLQNKNPYI